MGARVYAGKRVTVMGLGVLGGGVGTARWFANQGAIVTVTDMRDEAALSGSIAQLGDLPITYHLGGHRLEDFTSAGADIVMRNPGVPMDSPYLAAASESGVRIEMEMSVFFRACPSPIIGVTGTKGKTTVSALIGRILTGWKPQSLLAGNMGVPALLELDRLTPTTPVAIELSSFQIESLNDHHLAPHVAVFTNISPDHLDRYRDFEHYADTKRDMAKWMHTDDVAVINADDPNTAGIAGITSARIIRFGVGANRGPGAWLAGDRLIVDTGDLVVSADRPSHLSLAGDHGARNALAAMAASIAYGAPPEAVLDGLSTFAGVDNRLETVATIDGVTWVNDTSATAPVAAVAGVNVLAPRARTLHIIAGGADKRIDLAPFADALAGAGAVVHLLDGTATPGLRTMIEARSIPSTGPHETMEAAVASAQAAAKDGDIVALCPACASFGLFRNEFDRGARFRAAVLSLNEK